jgi:hypothetical protein
VISRRGAYRREATVPRSDSNVNRGVDPETVEFIEKYLTTYTKWEMLKHFAENPDSVESAKAFARRLNKDVRQTAEALKSLAKTGIISNGRGGEDAGYTLTNEEPLRSTLLRIAEAVRSNNRFRLLLNYHITKASLAKYKSRNP